MSLLVDPAISFWLLVAVGLAILAPLCLARSRGAVSKWILSLWIVSAVTLLWMGGWCWLLRDGLASGFVPSHGRVALVRFLDQFVFAVGVVGLENGVGWVCYKWRVKRLSSLR